MKAFAQSLEVDPEWFRSQFEQPMLFLRPLHYSAVQSRPEDGVFGAGAHSDYGLMTILATDGTPGLEILHEGAWTPVQLVDGAVLINLGDMAERCGPHTLRKCENVAKRASSANWCWFVSSSLGESALSRHT